MPKAGRVGIQAAERKKQRGVPWPTSQKDWDFTLKPQWSYENRSKMDRQNYTENERSETRGLIFETFDTCQLLSTVITLSVPTNPFIKV